MFTKCGLASVPVLMVRIFFWGRVKIGMNTAGVSGHGDDSEPPPSSVFVCVYLL